MDRSASKAELVLSRLLRPFAKVEPSEAFTALLLTVAVFSLLCGYYLLKTAREPLILLGGGAEVKSYAAAGQAALLLVAAWIGVLVALGREHRRRSGDAPRRLARSRAVPAVVLV